MQRIIKAGHAADAGLIFHIFAMDSTSTSGAGKASVAYSSFSCRYIRAGGAISGAITPEDITTIGTYAAPTANTNIRIKAVDNTNMIGVYEIQLHLDWVATGSEALTIFLTASGVAPIALTIPLVGINVQDSVRAGLTALPNAAADAAGGLPISDAGGLDLDALNTAAVRLTAARAQAIDDWINGGRLDLILDIIAADTTTDIPATLATIAGYIDTEIADLATAVADLPTNAELATSQAAADDATLAAIAAVDAKIDIVDTNVDAILVDTGTTLDGRIPAALTADGNMKADSLRIDGSAEAADRLQKSAEGIVYGTCDAGATTTSIPTSALSPAAAVADQFKGRIVIFDRATTTANLRGQATDITANTSGGTLTVTALTTAAASGDTFVIV